MGRLWCTVRNLRRRRDETCLGEDTLYPGSVHRNRSDKSSSPRISEHLQISIPEYQLLFFTPIDIRTRFTTPFDPYYGTREVGQTPVIQVQHLHDRGGRHCKGTRHGPE